jgi:microcystin degradation protein MlrC
MHAGTRIEHAQLRLPQVLLDTVTSRTQLNCAHGLLQRLHQRAVRAQAIDQRADRGVVRAAQVGGEAGSICMRPSRRSARPSAPAPRRR